MRKIIAICLSFIISAVVVSKTYAQDYDGNCLSFDGVNDFVEIPDDESLHVGMSNFTIECWFKSNGQAQDHSIFSTNRTRGVPEFSVHVCNQTEHCEPECKTTMPL